MIFSKIFEVRGAKMTKIQKNTARFDNLKQDFLDDKKYSGTAGATSFGLLVRKVAEWTTKPPCVGVFQVHQRGIAEDRICPESHPLH